MEQVLARVLAGPWSRRMRISEEQSGSRSIILMTSQASIEGSIIELLALRGRHRILVDRSHKHYAYWRSCVLSLLRACFWIIPHNLIVLWLSSSYECTSDLIRLLGQMMLGSRVTIIVLKQYVSKQVPAGSTEASRRLSLGWFASLVSTSQNPLKSCWENFFQVVLVFVVTFFVRAQSIGHFPIYRSWATLLLSTPDFLA
jgi:hypothetical protein